MYLIKGLPAFLCQRRTTKGYERRFHPINCEILYINSLMSEIHIFYIRANQLTMWSYYHQLTTRTDKLFSQIWQPIQYY